MKARIEIVNFRRLSKDPNDVHEVRIEQNVKYVSIVGEGDFIDFHSVEPFNKGDIQNEYFIVKNITEEYVEFLVKNCIGTKYLLNKELKQTSEEETIILYPNQFLFIDDSFGNIYNSTTIRVSEILPNPVIINQE